MPIDWNVKNAVNRDVERQHLNKILADIRATVDSINKTIQKPNTDVQSVVASMVEGNTEKGIDVSYNASKKVLDFVLTQFVLNLTGDVTGTATMTGEGDVTLVTELNLANGILTPAPIDGSPYWQLAGQWDYVGTILETLYYLDEPGIVAITDDLEAVVREIEGTAGDIVVTDGTGAAANPVISLADVTDSDTGTLQGITVDGKGRVTGTTDATITSGAGIDVVNGDAAAGPPTISHADTSSVTNISSDNSNGVVIQDISLAFDTFGHVQSISVGTVDLDTRYATSASIPTLAHGTYTPTLTNQTNVGSSVAYISQYSRVGNTVTVSGKVDITCIANSTVTELRLSLPIATVFTADQQLAGVANPGDVVGAGASGAYCRAELGGSTCRLRYVCGTNATTSRTWFFHFTYRIQ